MDGLERPELDKLAELLDQLDDEELFNLWYEYCANVPATLDDELLDMARQDEALAPKMIATAEAIIAGRKEVAK